MPDLSCHACGYDLAGLAESTHGRICPECGRINAATCTHCGHDLAGVPD
ncbi:MAG TPA: hypothetical protein VHC70_04155 [Phycisphaerales bacterium]|nr:hypothetical protein [Phycisphaerales bacterium]